MLNIAKYLQLYAEPEAHLCHLFPSTQHYENVLVIPAYKETSDFYNRFINSPLVNKKILLILVINQPVSEVDPQPQQRLNEVVIKSGQMIGQQHNLTLIQLKHVLAEVLVVDRYSSDLAIEDKQGVGLARKIGADIASNLIHKGIVNSPWICSTDADTWLPEDYFSMLTDIPAYTSAITYQFKHIDAQDQLSKATLLYETALRYYVSGLRWAGSDYAFYSIGSTLAFHYQYYAMVRGFPKRSAGEDFYLLNKLAKQGAIKLIDQTSLLITARVSDRVPFGTGPAVSKILSLADPDNDYLYYQSQLFIELRNCLNLMADLWQHKSNSQVWFAELSKPAFYALEQLRFDKLLQHIQNNATSEQQCQRHIKQWFDAFRTLKFIHYMQTKFYPPIALKKAISEAPFNV